MITIKLIAITVTLVMGWKVVTSENMLLEKVGFFLEKKVYEGHKFYDLFICAWCANSLFSIIAHFFAFGLGVLPFEFNWALLIRLPLIICAASFISGNLWNLYEISNRVKERNEAQTNYYEVKKDEILGAFGEDELQEEYFEQIRN